MYRFQTRRRWSIILKLFVLGLVMLNLIQTSISLIASHYNYPGANALLKLQTYKNCKLFLINKRLIKQKIRLDDSIATVHIDVYSAENGVSRFLEMKPWM
jgi:hypothetical protein